MPICVALTLSSSSYRNAIMSNFIVILPTYMMQSKYSDILPICSGKKLGVNVL